MEFTSQSRETRDAASANSREDKPDFLQPAFDLGVLPRCMKPPKLPSETPSPATSIAGMRVSVPQSPRPPSNCRTSRGSSPRRRLVTPSSGGSPTPRAGSSCSLDRSSSAGSTGLPAGGSLLGCTAYSGTGVTGSQPNSKRASPVDADFVTLQRQEMMARGYLPAEDYDGILQLSKEYREQHKRLHAELVNVRVEHERLRMEEEFLRQRVLQAGLDPPQEVSGSTTASSSQGGQKIDSEAALDK